jgi:hypothetical protein
MSTCKASCAARLGRNPNEQFSMSASKTGSSTIFTAACTTRSRTVGIDSGRCSRLPGFGMNTRRAGTGRHAPSRKFIEQPINAVLLDVRDGLSVDACCAAIAAHLDPRPLQYVSAIDLVRERVEPSPGLSLGRPVERMLQGTDRIARRSQRGGASHNGTHRALLDERYASTKQRPFPHRRLCCPLGSRPPRSQGDQQYYGRLRRPPGSPPTSRREPVIGRDAPATRSQVTGPGRASPVPAATI